MLQVSDTCKGGKMRSEMPKQLSTLQEVLLPRKPGFPVLCAKSKTTPWRCSSCETLTNQGPRGIKRGTVLLWPSHRNPSSACQ